MKKISTLLAALLFTGILFAQSRLSIGTTGDAGIRIMIDGRKYPANNNTFMLNNVNSGFHNIKIYRQANKRNKSQFGYPNSKYELVYNGNLYLKPQYHTDITINRFGKTLVDEQLLNNGYYENDDDNWGVNDNDRHFNNYGSRAMDNTAFQQFKQSCEKEPFDNTRMKIAKQFMPMNYFTTAQVKELIGIFSFENNKLDMAKYAYDYTVDKGNYYVVNDAFSFTNSKEALMDYIKSRK
jgi:hypothetical protein